MTKTRNYYFILVALCLLAGRVALAQQQERLFVQPDSVMLTDSLILTQPDSIPKAPVVLLDSLNYRFFGEGNFTHGNSNRSLLVLRAEILLNGPVLSIATNPRFSYGKQNGVLAERDTYVDLFVDVFKKRKTYVFGLGTIEISNLRGIELRKLAGAGIGYRLLQTKRHELSFTNAIIHESTNFKTRATLVTQRNSFRMKGSHHFFGDKLRFLHLTFAQPSLEDFSNLRWNTLLSLEVPLTTWIAIRTSFANTYESEVEANRKHNDSQIIFGVSISKLP